MHGVLSIKSHAILFSYIIFQYSWVNEFKYLGLFLDNCLTFAAHIDYISDKCSAMIGCLSNALNKYRSITTKTLKIIYSSCVFSAMFYASEIYVCI